MNNNPFFSVLIPTKNRSHIVGMAIQSVLNQTFKDFEIIVSDNDDSDTLTRDAVAKFSDDRIKYFRTSGNLSMPDNWEFALTKATGRYITVLEDKQVFYPDALEVLNNMIISGYGHFIVWNCDILDDIKEPPVLFRWKNSGEIYSTNTDKIISHMTNKGILYKKLPRMINSCVPKEFVDFIWQKTPLKRFFNNCCPDFTAAFIQLNYIDRITYVDKSLTITGAKKLSNGLSSRKKGNTAQRFSKEIGEIYFYDYVPIKAIMANNAIINDYYRTVNKVGGRLKQYCFCQTVYLSECYKDIIETEQYGANVRNEYKLWKSFFTSQNPEIKFRTIWKIKLLIIRRYSFKFYKILPRFEKLVLHIKNKVDSSFECITGYDNAYDAAGYQKDY